MAFWVTLLRGFFAVGLGIALFINPDKAQPLLANFMGFYWLGSGVIALRWSASGNGSGRLVVIAAIIGILAGLATVSRHLTRTIVDESLIVTTLGVVIILTVCCISLLAFVRKMRNGAVNGPDHYLEFSR